MNQIAVTDNEKRTVAEKMEKEGKTFQFCAKNSKIDNHRTVWLERQSIIREKIVSFDRGKKVARREQLDGEFEHFNSSETFLVSTILAPYLAILDSYLATLNPHMACKCSNSSSKNNSSSRCRFYLSNLQYSLCCSSIYSSNHGNFETKHI